MDAPWFREARRADRAASSLVASALGAKSSAGADDDAAADPNTARRRTLISLLQTLQKSRRLDNMSALFSLVAWTQSADQDELAECLALSDETMTQNTRHGLGDLMHTLVFARWGALDGPAALEAWLALPEDKRSNEARNQLFVGWSGNGDPQDALDHVFASVPEAEASSTAADVLTAWQLQDPAAATDCAIRLAASANPAEQEAGAEVAIGLLDRVREERGASAALEWIDRWPASRRDQLRLRLLRELDSDAPDSPAAAGRILAKLDNPALDPEGGIDHLARKFATRAPAEAQRWAANLPEPARAEAVSAVAHAVVEGLLEKGRAPEATTWLENQPLPADARAAGYEQLADSAARNGNLGEAVRLAGQAAGEPTRLPPEKQGQLLQQWLENHPERAAKVVHLLTESPNPAVPVPSP